MKLTCFLYLGFFTGLIVGAGADKESLYRVDISGSLPPRTSSLFAAQPVGLSLDAGQLKTREDYQFQPPTGLSHPKTEWAERINADAIRQHAIKYKEYLKTPRTGPVPVLYPTGK